MTIRKIVYTQKDGTLAVVTPIRNTIGETLIPVINELDEIVYYREMTDNEIEQRAWDKLPSYAINPKFIEAHEIPTDRTFRNAWRYVADEIYHDMPHARNIMRDLLRAKRTQSFQLLDSEWMRAKGRKREQEADEIESKRELLRNLPQDPRIEECTNVIQLKALLEELSQNL